MNLFSSTIKTEAHGLRKGAPYSKWEEVSFFLGPCEPYMNVWIHLSKFSVIMYCFHSTVISLHEDSVTLPGS